MSHSRFGKYFDDFVIGESYAHWPGKTITESDNNLFCLLTMNHHPIHLDHNYASKAKYNKVMVAGTLTFSLVVGLTVADISGAAIANLGYDQVRHISPVFINDTIYAHSKIIDKRQSSGEKKHGVVMIETIAKNQQDVEVLSFRRSILVSLTHP